MQGDQDNNQIIHWTKALWRKLWVVWTCIKQCFLANQ